MIEREDFDWGTRLTARPVKRDQKLTIEADIHRPPTNQRTEIYVNFRGALHMRQTDARIWASAMNAILSEANKVAEEYVPQKKKATRKKTAKKKASKKKR